MTAMLYGFVLVNSKIYVYTSIKESATKEMTMQDTWNQLMAEYYVTFEELAVRLGISKQTLTRKMKGLTEWTFGEMSLLIQIFNIQDPEAFFFGN